MIQASIYRHSRRSTSRRWRYHQSRCHALPRRISWRYQRDLFVSLSFLLLPFLTLHLSVDPVGSSVSQTHLDVIACARECLDESIRLCKPGFQYQDIGKHIEMIASKRGFTTNKCYVGHGIHQSVYLTPCSSSLREAIAVLL